MFELQQENKKTDLGYKLIQNMTYFKLKCKIHAFKLFEMKKKREKLMKQ